MEAILSAVGIIIAIVVFNLALRGLTGTVKAVGRSAIGKGSITENLDAEFRGLGNFQIRTKYTPKMGDDPPIDFVAVECKGLIPVRWACDIRFIISALDKTDGDPRPILSTIDQFQESETIAFQHDIAGGHVEPNHGFIGWVRIGGIIPEILLPPRGGKRTVLAVVRIYEAASEPGIQLGFGSNDDPGLLGTYTAEFTHDFKELKGYEEAQADRDKANALAVRLAVAVSMADGSMDENEGVAIKMWIQKVLSGYSDQRQEELRDACNAALRDAYHSAQTGSLSISDVAAAMNELADDTMKYQAIELCMDVMAADGVADASELDMIRKIAASLELDFEEIQKLKDQRMVSLQSVSSDENDLQAILGIDDEWGVDQIRAHLRAEFRKWNSRLNNLQEGTERDNAQQMLNLIAEARKRYG